MIPERVPFGKRGTESRTGAFSKKGQRFFRKPAENTGKYLKTGANGYTVTGHKLVILSAPTPFEKRGTAIPEKSNL